MSQSSVSTPPDQQAVQHVFQLMTGHMVASAVNTVAQLAIPDRLANGPRSADDLAREAGVNADALYRVMRALASVGVFDELDRRTFALTPAGEALKEGPVRAMALWIACPLNLRVHADAMHSLKTGAPAVEVTVGEGAFAHFAKNPDISRIFNDAMTAFSSVVIPAVLEAYDFSGIKTLVDVAGGHGGVLTGVLQEYPGMTGILFDLEHVIEGARPRIASLGLSERVTTASGDFFKAVPSGGDAYIMKHIIHDWDDDRAAAILENIRKVLPKDGRVILIESVIPPGNEPSLGKIIDLEMLVMPGGRERTADEFGRLFERAGYHLTRIMPTQSPLSVIEARPN